MERSGVAGEASGNEGGRVEERSGQQKAQPMMAGLLCGPAGGFEPPCVCEAFCGTTEVMPCSRRCYGVTDWTEWLPCGMQAIAVGLWPVG